MHACWCGTPAAIAKQLSRGGDPNKIFEGLSAALPKVPERGKEWDPAMAGETPLTAAVFSGRVENVRALLDGVREPPRRKLDVERPNGHGMKPLAVAADRTLAVVKVLVNEAGANVNALSLLDTTALSVAAAHGSDEVGAEIAQFLVEHGADVEARDTEGRTALMRAAHCNNQAVCTELLKRHSKGPVARDAGGRTVMHYAAANGHLRIVMLLSELYGPRSKEGIDVRDKEGNTPLLLAAAGGYLPVVELLAGTWEADPHAANKRKVTPLDVARSKGYAAIHQYLKTGHTGLEEHEQQSQSASGSDTDNEEEEEGEGEYGYSENEGYRSGYGSASDDQEQASSSEQGSSNPGEGYSSS